MPPAQLYAYLKSARTLTCATNGPRGLPHLAPLWFDVTSAPTEPKLVLVAWTYGSSQKVANLRRDPRATLQVESGDQYDQLAGATLECDVALVEERDAVLRVGRRLAERYRASAPKDDAIAGQAAKRIVLEFRERRRASWDHARVYGAG